MSEIFTLPDGSQEHWSPQGLHREDGPAVERSDGAREWWREGKRHRDGGPAVESPSQTSWWQEGKLHRDAGPAVERRDGYKAWYQNGLPHRDGGPAVEYPEGVKLYYQNGLLHRDDGPAIERDSDTWDRWSQGAREWWREGKRHRDEGPAVEHLNGYKAWYQDGLLHRQDGPAVIYADGREDFFEQGVLLEDGKQANPETPEEVVASYEVGTEANRLYSGGYPSLEFERARQAIMREFPRPPAKVLDIGGGPGIYSSWLATLGYEVQLVEPVPLHVSQAKMRPGAKFEATLGDARNLPLADNSVDAVVMFGPLYHLQSKEDRQASLSESARVLKPGGVLIASSLNRHVGLLHGVSEDWFTTPAYRKAMEQAEGGVMLGGHHPLHPRPEWFSTAYGHLPQELAQEVEEAGYQQVQVVGKEGPGWLLPNMGWDSIINADQQDSLLWAADFADRSPDLAVLGSHLMVTARLKR